MAEVIMLPEKMLVDIKGGETKDGGCTLIDGACSGGATDGKCFIDKGCKPEG